MKRTLLLFVVLVLGVSGLRAQHFEWAKGYSSSQEGNVIKGSVTDSAGNLYILGQFRNTAAWDGGSHLLPMAPYGPYTDVYNVLIAKITPDGEMAWKKVIHCNNGANSGGADIKIIGDTAFACLINFSLPNSGSNYCYYLDTLLTATCDYPTPNGNMSYASRTALITFDFDGHVLEQHFLTLTFHDNDGNDILSQNPAGYYKNSRGLHLPSFDVDQEGNVYLCRVGGDLVDQTYATWRGNVGGIKYWVDGRVVGQSEVRNSPMGWYPQLLKFSPHMDTLLTSRYLVQRCDTNIDYQTDNLYIELDRNGNPYLIGSLSTSIQKNNVLVFDSTKNIVLSHSANILETTYLIVFDPSLQVACGVFFKDEDILHPEMFSASSFWDISFDYDSNLLFVSASTFRGVVGDTVNFHSILSCQNHFLDRLKNDAFIMAFSMQGDSLIFHSYGRVPGMYESSYKSAATHGNLGCANNRVFVQSLYRGGVHFPNETIHFPNWSNVGIGLSEFDYKCKIIDGKDYNALSINNDTGPLSVHDSILYLSNYLVSNATFGDIHVPAQGYNACIAKYVDTAFMTPYVPPTVHIGQAEAIPLRLYPNPTHGTVRIDTDGEPVRSAAILTVYGQRTPLQVDGDRMELTGCPAGVYILEITTHNNKYHQKIIVL